MVLYVRHKVWATVYTIPGQGQIFMNPLSQMAEKNCQKETALKATNGIFIVVHKSV